MLSPGQWSHAVEQSLWLSASFPFPRLSKSDSISLKKKKKTQDVLTTQDMAQATGRWSSHTLVNVCKEITIRPPSVSLCGRLRVELRGKVFARNV